MFYIFISFISFSFFGRGVGGWKAFVLFTEFLINIYFVFFILLENKRHFLHVISMYKKQLKTKQKTQILSVITNHTYKYHNINNSSINISECQYSLANVTFTSWLYHHLHVEVEEFPEGSHEMVAWWLSLQWSWLCSQSHSGSGSLWSCQQ